MARNPRLAAAVRRALLTRRTGWGLAAALLLLGILLGWQQLTRAASMAGQGLAEAGRLVPDAGWLLFLLAAVGLVLGLAFSSRRRAAFPAALILVGVGLGLCGRLALVSSTPTPPRLENQGHIMVYTSDPKARVVLSIGPLPPRVGWAYYPSGHWMDVGVLVEYPTEAQAKAQAGTPLVWAVALGGDAQFPPGFPPSDLSAREFIAPIPPLVVNIMNGVSWFPSPASGGEGTVIFGRGEGRARLRLSMFVPMREPLLEDVGEFVTVNTPTLGRVSHTDLRVGRQSRQEPIGFDSEKADPQLLAKLRERPLYEPERLELRLAFDGFHYPQLADARQEAGTAPVAPFRPEWRAMDTLQVQASFRRPSEATKNQRWVFLAGVLVSLAASFFVWALELLLGPRRDPVAAPQRPP
jgi:hypothetical protein